MKKRFAFTITEVLLALAIIAFVSVLGMYAFSTAGPNSKFSSKVDRLKFKNANLTFKYTLSNLISNPAYYSDESGFTDLDEVNFNDKYIQNNVSFSGKEKFRHLFLKELGIPIGSKNLDCYMLINSIKPERTDLCYIGDNGVVWGIPDTDFVDYGVIEQENMTGGNSYYAPVTMYVNASNIDSEDSSYHNAVVIGVRADGSTVMINTVKDCENKRSENYAQCDIADVFASTNSRSGK